MSDEPPRALEKHSRWPGWIWALPVAACLIVAYLAFKQLSQSGPTVTVTVPTGGPIKANDTKVKFQGMDVGVVNSVHFQKDLRHIDVDLELKPDLDGHLGKGTRFWIDGQKPSITDLSSLKSVISGPFIGIEPHDGKAQSHYEGLPERPVNANNNQGTAYELRADKLGTISRGSVIYYRDLQVGEVEETKLEPDNRHFRISIFVNAPYDHLIRTDTRFWDASAVQLSLAAGGPKLQMQSIPSLFEGAIDFETPDGSSSAALPKTRFTLYHSKDEAEHAPGENAPRYRVTFQGADAANLSEGAAVTLENKRVGSVVDSTLQYDPASGKLRTVATLAINPHAIDLPAPAAWSADARPQMDQMFRRLIKEGLRARLGRSIPMVGGAKVELAFVPDAQAASLGQGSPPELPTGPQSDVSGILSAVNAVAAKINAMPLDQIAGNVHQITEHVAGLTDSPEVKSSLQHLDSSLANIEQVTREAKGQVAPILAELRRVAAEAQRTVASARNLVSSQAAGAQREPGTAGLGNTLYELGRAAKSLRELADYLDRHPEALIRGRGTG